MKKMNHNEYMRSLKTKADDVLRFIIKDASKAMEAMPDNPNSGYYADEICYAAMELKSREVSG